MGPKFGESLWSGRQGVFLPSRQPFPIGWGESVHLLVGNYSLNDSILIEAGWQGKLDKDPVDSGIRVQLAEQSFKLVLRRVSWQMMVLGMDSNFFSSLVFPS